eukprot:3842888-Prymnesium_polylepis.1
MIESSGPDDDMSNGARAPARKKQMSHETRDVSFRCRAPPNPETTGTASRGAIHSLHHSNLMS